MSQPSLRDRLTQHLEAVLQTMRQEGELQGNLPAVLLLPPKHATYGAYSCSIALGLAAKPRPLALRLQALLGDAGGLLQRCEVAGPGYLNLYVAKQTWLQLLQQMVAQPGQFVRSQRGAGARVLLEYVSANPTGPLHVAHGRGAVLGDCLARLLRAAGYAVEREYYVNDLGKQIAVMGHSIYFRYAALCAAAAGQTVVHEPPADFYPGAYITEIAASLYAQHGARYWQQPVSQWLTTFSDFGVAQMRQRITADLAAYGVEFDQFVSERQLTQQSNLVALLARLEQAKHIYVQDGKKWFRTTAFGDDKDRVVCREDGQFTYFATDIAYHDDKMRRGFQRLINIWGADHGGYLARVQAGMQALGHDISGFKVIFVQMVSVTRGQAQVKMGKRLGTAVWLRDIIEEVGKDAARYFFLMRRGDSQMDFDVDLATRQSLDNPVFYAQMGYARLASIAQKALQAGFSANDIATADLQWLTLPEEIELLQTMARAPDVLNDAAAALEPHQMVHYLQGLIAQFHSYYSRYKNSERVISAERPKSCARLQLCQALQNILHELLDLLGIEAPNSMRLSDTQQLDALF